MLLVQSEIYYVPIGDGWEEVLVRNVLHYILFWAQMALALLVPFQGPPLPMPLIMMSHSSKPLSISSIKTTVTLVVLCTRVLLCTVVVCCCVLEGWGGLLVAVLCDQVFRGRGLAGRAPPPPPTIV